MAIKKKGQKGKLILEATVDSKGLGYKIEASNISDEGIIEIMENALNQLKEELKPCMCTNCQIQKAIEGLFK